jgi:DNA invertase Pin-like site-specific DNA recombinase
MKAAIYARTATIFSDDPSEVQIARLTALAESRGLSVLATFSDEGVSGLTSDRAGLTELLDQLRAPRRAWRVLLVRDVARLSRDHIKLSQLLDEFRAANCELLVEELGLRPICQCCSDFTAACPQIPMEIVASADW